MEKSNIFIISGPSGSGQDSVIEGLKDHLPIERIITTTTRDRREGETEGDPYYFVSMEEMQEMISREEMAEYAKEYNDKVYGVTEKELERVASLKNKIGIWRIEYKGVITAKKKFPEIKSVLIAPPSLETLRERILRRDGEVSDKFLEERMRYSEEFMKHEDIYDFKVVNEEGKLEETVLKVAEIIKQNAKFDQKDPERRP